MHIEDFPAAEFAVSDREKCNGHIFAFTRRKHDVKILAGCHADPLRLSEGLDRRNMVAV